MSAPLLWRHFVQLQSAPMTAITLAAAGSFLGQIAALIQGAPLWLYAIAAIAPWLPIFALELTWAYRHYKWIAVFCLLIVSQAAYLLEHTAQMMQIVVLGRATTDAPGVFGALDATRVYFLWASWALLAVLLLVNRFPRNPWLWVLLVIASMDATEHVALFAGGVRVVAADLEFLLSLLEVVTLAMAFMWQLRRTYDAWLARAFPQLPERVLIETTGRLEELCLRASETIQFEAHQCYIITRGTGTLTRTGPGGHEILLQVVSPGQVVNDAGALYADTALEVLTLPSAALSTPGRAAG